MDSEHAAGETPATAGALDGAARDSLPDRLRGFVRGELALATGRPDRMSIGAAIEHNAARFPERVAVLGQGRSITWSGLNALANRIAHRLRAAGIGRGDTVSVLMENRIEHLAAVIGIAKLGAVGGILNTNLRGRPLVHCIEAVGGRKVIVGEELVDALAPVRDRLGLEDGTDYLWLADGTRGQAPAWAADFGRALDDAPAGNPSREREPAGHDPCYYIFTSGTTGLPKAAIMSHGRWFKAAYGFGQMGLALRPGERIYICLPLYHNNALTVAFGSAVLAGASVVLRRRFSASAFWDDVRATGADCFIYIGEMCRYLYNRPARAEDADNPVTKIIGNGLRPDIWQEFKQRFAIPRVVEFYAASEGNAAFVNVFNQDCTIGTTTSPHALVAYDVDNDEILRDARGRCRRAARGEPGLLLTRITPKFAFDGYVDRDASERKVVRDAFRKGDAWFNTGDLVRRVRVRGLARLTPHYQFVDRVGDTFRWKGENVSTTEVAEILNEFDQVRFSNVYGVQVPGAEGRAGMAALALDCPVEAFDGHAFARHVENSLPVYARPVFVRLIPDLDVTDTFKLKKGRLRERSYHPDGDAVLYYRSDAGGYVPLDESIIERIDAGREGL